MGVYNPKACCIKTLRAVISSNTAVSLSVCHVYPSVIFDSKDMSLPLEGSLVNCSTRVGYVCVCVCVGTFLKFSNTLSLAIVV